MNKFIKGYGSDEVGTGVYLLPSVYCCVFLDEKKFLEILKICKKKNLVIKDSKELYSNKRKKIYKVFSEIVDYEVYVLSNQEYNFFEQEYHWNDNVKKAFAHFKVFTNLKKKINKDEPWSIDKFCEIASFKKYFFQIKKTFKENNFGWIEFENINLVSYGDKKNLAIALASIFARTIFEEEKVKLEKKYCLRFPLGSKTTEIIEFVKKFKEKYSLEEFLNLSKKKYKTTELFINIFK
ncbi:hypothetical protein JTY60_01200 [symbiont of Argiope bruennichi]|uniref:hypothetical protein n=1 Tax=symbiont of Argiope bruennichi TaxID=2810479 RepID=UPI003DA69C94